MKNLLKLVTFMLAATFILTACDSENKAEGTSLQQAQDLVLNQIDTDFGYNIMVELTKFKTNEDLGYRTSGSAAELAAGDYIKEMMESIGLENISKDEFTLDTWTFDHANLKFSDANGESYEAILGAYQTNFDTKGEKEFSIVYAGAGTQADFEGLDVTGKLVLIEIDQRENWWINFPTYEAYLNGAAAVIAVQSSGYAEVSDDALNAQDICGPDYAPAFSISRTDANAILAALEASDTNEITVTFDALSTVEMDGTTYNITGMIPGKDSEKMILVTSHYDGYFDAFQDNAAAVAIMLNVAKSIIDSGYQPEKTLVFCSTAAEEWGVSNSRYDWLTGAYNQIFNIHPEWAGKVVANINFEMPGFTLGEDSTSLRTSYELASFVSDVALTVPTVEGAFPNGTEITYPTATWSDDFAFSIAGIPSSVSNLVFDFLTGYYHSQFDNADTYSEAAYRYQNYLYSTLLLAYDYCAISPLDFTTRFEALETSINDDFMAMQGVDSTELKSVVAEAINSAKAAYTIIQEKNNAYSNARTAGNESLINEILSETNELYSLILETFKLAEDELVRLTWDEEVVFPHEIPQSNLEAIVGAIEALKAGNAALALDEYLWTIDSNWYAYDFSKENFDFFTALINQPADRLQWGAGRVISKEDLYDVIHSIMNKLDAGEVDFTDEINSLSQVKDRQITLLNQTVTDEIKALETLTTTLNSIK